MGSANTKPYHKATNNFSGKQELQQLFNIQTSSTSLNNWCDKTITLIENFLIELKTSIVPSSPNNKISILISYVEENLEIVTIINIFKNCFKKLNLLVTLAKLTTSHDLSQKINSHDLLFVCCTQNYLKAINPLIRRIINDFGKQAPDILFPLLFEGEFQDALQIVDKNYFIRDCTKIINTRGMAPIRS